MDPSTRAPGYDLFKLIVAIVLLILALVLMWTGSPASPVSTTTPAPPTVTVLSQPATVSLSPTPAPPTMTVLSQPATVFLSPTPAPPTMTALSTPSGTALPGPSPTPIPSPTPTPAPPADIPVTACDTAVARSRLQVGTNATLRRRLNFRSSPGLRDNWLRTNIPGTQIEVVGGPECVPYWTGAYLWWQIRLPDGSVGWSAEGSLHGSFYFMEPNQ